MPSDGAYTLRVRAEPPTIMRHDEVNGKRFLEEEEVEFEDVAIEPGPRVSAGAALKGGAPTVK